VFRHVWLFLQWGWVEWDVTFPSVLRIRRFYSSGVLWNIAFLFSLWLILHSLTSVKNMACWFRFWVKGLSQKLGSTVFRILFSQFFISLIQALRYCCEGHLRPRIVLWTLSHQSRLVLHHRGEERPRTRVPFTRSLESGIDLRIHLTGNSLKTTPAIICLLN